MQSNSRSTFLTRLKTPHHLSSLSQMAVMVSPALIRLQPIAAQCLSYLLKHCSGWDLQGQKPWLEHEIRSQNTQQIIFDVLTNLCQFWLVCFRFINIELYFLKINWLLWKLINIENWNKNYFELIRYVWCVWQLRWYNLWLFGHWHKKNKKERNNRLKF